MNKSNVSNTEPAQVNNDPITKISTSEWCDPPIDKFVKHNNTCLSYEFELDPTTQDRKDHEE